MKALLVTAAVALVFSGTLAAQTPLAFAPCVPAGSPELICGQDAPEDLVVLPGAQWVVASAYAGAGGINLIHVSDHKSVAAYPSAAAGTRLDATTYATCPGPPSAARNATFTTHGLWLQQGRNGIHRLFAVGHGTRESVEVFEVDARGATPAFTWVGCVVAPDPIGLNSVRGLPDGGFIATNFLPRGVSEATRARMLAGEKNGELWEWHTASGWKKVPGSETSGANGLEISDDGNWFYVAAWGSQSFFRLSRGQATPVREEIPLGFRVDNLRWARDGALLAAGQGESSSVVIKINTRSLTVTELTRRADDGRFQAGTVAVEIGRQFWVGSYIGDRIAIFPAR